MDIKSVTKDYVECASGGTVTVPFNGSWISAYAIALGATDIKNGSWLQTLCEQLGILAPVNSSWVIALANHYGITQPVNGSWWYAIADNACNPPTPPFTGILDDYTGAEVAYSAARRLSSTYTGPLVEVIKSGGVATDIGYDAVTNELDTTALAAYAGTDTVYVRTWYDQTGNGHHAQQTTVGQQPIIVTTGTIETLNGKVAVKFDGVNDFMPLVSNVQSDAYGMTVWTYNRVNNTLQVSLGDDTDTIWAPYSFNNNRLYFDLGNNTGLDPGIVINTFTGHQTYTCWLHDDAGTVKNKLFANLNTAIANNDVGTDTTFFNAYGTRQLIQYTGNLHNEYIFWRGLKTEVFAQGAHNNAGTYYGTV